MCEATQDIEILAVVHLPLPMDGFIGLLRGMEDGFKDSKEQLFIRNCEVGYEIFRHRSTKKHHSNNL